MTNNDILEVIERFQVRPGGMWRYDLDLIDPDAEMPVLVIEAYTRDSRDERYFDEYPPDALPTALKYTRALASCDTVTEAALVRVILESIANFAAHEVLEWTRYDGVMPYDPHVIGEPSVYLNAVTLPVVTT